MSRIEPLKDEENALIDTRDLLSFSDLEGAPDLRVVRIWGRTQAGATWLKACEIDPIVQQRSASKAAAA